MSQASLLVLSFSFEATKHPSNEENKPDMIKQNKEIELKRTNYKQRQTICTIEPMQQI
jgi:hypothetical protein